MYIFQSLGIITRNYGLKENKREIACVTDIKANSVLINKSRYGSFSEGALASWDLEGLYPSSRSGGLWKPHTGQRSKGAQANINVK